MPGPSYVGGTSLVPLLGETIGQNLRRTVDRFPDCEALVSVPQGYRATYRQFWEETSLVARGLMARGVKRGDRVGIWSPNRFEWVIVQYATARMGAVLVNVNPAYRLHELEYALKQSGVSTLLLAVICKLRGIAVLQWGFGYHPPRGARESDVPHRLLGLTTAIKRSFTRLADGFIAYTKSGAERVIESGYPRERTFFVQNTIDMTEQRRLYEAERDTDPQAIRR